MLVRDTLSFHVNMFSIVDFDSTLRFFEIAWFCMMSSTRFRGAKEREKVAHPYGCVQKCDFEMTAIKVVSSFLNAMFHGPLNFDDVTFVVKLLNLQLLCIFFTSKETMNFQFGKFTFSGFQHLSISKTLLLISKRLFEIPRPRIEINFCVLHSDCAKFLIRSK